MSMQVSILDTPLTNFQQLTDYFKAGEKPESDYRIGVEHEKFLVDKNSQKPLPYDGERSILWLMTKLQDHGWAPVHDQDHVIGLKRGTASISLEPGGQFELSGAPMLSVAEVKQELDQHLAELNPLLDQIGAEIIWKGFHPTARREDMANVPKSRYVIMKNYMPKVGQLGLDMMLRTCSIQLNLDYSSEADMVQKMRVGYALTPLVMAYFANSPAHGYVSYRSKIWQDTDPDRSGIPAFVFKDDMGYAAYANYALDVPMYFIVRDNTYIDTAGLSFRDFLEGKILKEYQPTLADWENHLSTLFPEVRLKTFLEFRCADLGVPPKIMCLTKFWTGIIYKKAMLNQIDLHINIGDLLDAYKQVPKLGLNATLAGKRLVDSEMYTFLKECDQAE